MSLYRFKVYKYNWQRVGGREESKISKSKQIFLKQWNVEEDAALNKHLWKHIILFREHILYQKICLGLSEKCVAMGMFS